MTAHLRKAALLLSGGALAITSLTACSEENQQDVEEGVNQVEEGAEDTGAEVKEQVEEGAEESGEGN